MPHWLLSLLIFAVLDSQEVSTCLTSLHCKPDDDAYPSLQDVSGCHALLGFKPANNACS